MKKMFGLPIDLETISSNNDKINIDMSKLSFPCDEDKQIRSSLIFLRNTGVKVDLYFENCSYEEKSKFLMIYLNDKIVIDIPELSVSWIKILSYGYLNIDFPSILNDDEIKKFNEENKDFIFEIHRFMVSLPLCAINYFANKSERGDIDINEYESTDYDGINMKNFIHLFDYEEFLFLVQNIMDIDPIFYNKYFYFNENYNPYIEIFLNKMPYLNILNIMLDVNEESQQEFIDGIKNILDNLGNESMEDK